MDNPPFKSYLINGFTDDSPPKDPPVDANAVVAGGLGVLLPIVD
jgi:hypothetical protein